MSDPKYAYPYAAQGYPQYGYQAQGYPPQGYPTQAYYQQAPPVVAPPVYQQQPQRKQAGFLEGCLAALCCCFLVDECCFFLDACCDPSFLFICAIIHCFYVTDRLSSDFWIGRHILRQYECPVSNWNDDI